MRKTISIVSLLFCIGAFAQSPGEIHGKVFDIQGNPLFAATVWVYSSSGIQGTTTDFDGKFKIKPLDPGTYTLYAKYVAMDTLVVPSVPVNPDAITFRNRLELQPNSLTGVTIVAYPVDLIEMDNPNVMKINSTDFIKSAAATDMSTFISTQVPAVKKDGRQLYFRGSRPQNVATFIDGVKIPGSEIPNIPRSAIKNMAIYTGGVPAKYGDVTGGVVIYETKSYMDLWNERRAARLKKEMKAGA